MVIIEYTRKKIEKKNEKHVPEISDSMFFGQANLNGIWTQRNMLALYLGGRW